MKSISRYITSRYLAYANAAHIKQYPQLVGFAFDAITCSIHLDGQFEKDELRLLEESVFPKLERNTICLDIGANIGNHSLSFSPFFEYIIALEPHPVSFKLLQINAELVKNVKAIQIGASDKTGSVKVAVNKFALFLFKDTDDKVSLWPNNWTVAAVVSNNEPLMVNVKPPAA